MTEKFELVQTKTKTFNVKLTGVSPLLLHRDDVDWRGKMEEWLKIPANKKASKAGDDRSPAYRWIGALYHDDEYIGVPSDNLMTLIREGAAKVATGGKNGETFKRISQSCLLVDQILWPIVGPKGQMYRISDVAPLMDEATYSAHVEAVRKLGYELFAKPAKVGTSKHVRVRPRFNNWSIAGTITSMDARLDRDALYTILSEAGRFCGLGDWRASSPKSPGHFGMFTAEVK